MAIITISRGSFSKGRDVACKVAEKLGYSLMSREICIEASDEFNAPQVKVCRAIHDAPSFFDRFTYGRQRYIAYIASAILDRFQQDNVVYHGLAGHFFVNNIAHVLKVRIIADRQDRIRLATERDQISEEEATRRLDEEDHHRRQWSLNLYGVDTWDPDLYDLLIHTRKLSVDDAADIICHTVAMKQFETTATSRKALDELALAARVKAALVRDYPNLKVEAKDRSVRIRLCASSSLEQKIVTDVRCRAADVQGVEKVSVHLVPTSLYLDLS